MDNKDKLQEEQSAQSEETSAPDPVLIKKTAGVCATALLSVAVILTGFVFGQERPDKEVKAASPVSSSQTTAADSVSSVESSTSATDKTEPSGEQSVSTTTENASKKPEKTDPPETEPAAVPDETDPPAPETEPPAPETQAPETAPPRTDPPATEPPQTRPPQTDPPRTDPPETSKKPAQGNSGSMNVTANVVNSWEESGSNCFQVDFIIKNSSGSEVSGWTVTASFSGSLEIVNSWNGNFSVNGSSVVVTPVDYNTAVPANGEVTFGVIIKSSGEASVGSVTVK